MERFWSKVDKTPGHGKNGDCWIWTAALRSSKTGYGAFRLYKDGIKRTVDSHRASFEINVGDIPEELCVLHSCDNRKCVKPSHLFLGTKKDNTQDCISKGRFKGSGVTQRKVGPKGTSWCFTCKDFLPEINFNKNKSIWNGLSVQCKECKSNADPRVNHAKKMERVR